MKLTISITISLVFLSLQGQEIITIPYNPALQNIEGEVVHLKAAKPNIEDTISIDDFFDDFNYYYKSVYPSKDIWLDNQAYVSHSYIANPLSVGVVTLDAVDEHGNYYQNAGKHADTLTSKKVDLEEISSDSVFFSFFLQGGGLVDAPDEDKNDSLIVEFFYSDSSTWHKVWAVNGYKSETFDQVIIPVPDSFRTNGFQLRFRNFVSLDVESGHNPNFGYVDNSDFWHIDYIQLKQASSQEQMKELNDIFFVEPATPSFENYTALPDFHLGDKKNRDPIFTKMRTGFASPVPITRHHSSWQINPGGSLTLIDEIDLGPYDLFGTFQFEDRDWTPLSDIVPSSDHNSKYLRKYTFNTSNVTQTPENDTLFLLEEFKDYYAYDDGVPEVGLGFTNGGNFSVALYYKLRASSDTITAIDIHFIKAAKKATEEYPFQLCIWEGDPLQDVADTVPPLKLVYISEKEGGYTPSYIAGKNEFKRYKLEEPVVVGKNYYVGIYTINATGIINLGYDMSVDNRKRMFINNGQGMVDGEGWFTATHSLPVGTPMFRPVFRDISYTNSIENHWQNPLKITVFPNPVNEYFNVEVDENDIDINNLTIGLFDIMGRNVRNNISPNNAVYINDLPPGIYIVRAYNTRTGQTGITKIINKGN